jgi:hypothetical protein
MAFPGVVAPKPGSRALPWLQRRSEACGGWLQDAHHGGARTDNEDPVRCGLKRGNNASPAEWDTRTDRQMEACCFQSSI